jgi:hypothetical protein
MSQGEQQFTNRPLPDAEIQPLGYLIGLQFHPPIKLIHAKGLEFAAQLSAHVDAPRELELQENQWTFTQPLGDRAAGVFQVAIQESQVIVEAAFPTHPLEWLERRFEFIVSEFRKMFTPGLLLGSRASVRGTLQVDGDARVFLTTHVTMMEKKRLAPLDRPVHLFGIHLVMPPFQLQQQPPAGKKGRKVKIIKSADWISEVRVESLLEDSRKLFLETTGQWQTPGKWDEEATKDVVGHLAVVSGFLKGNLVPFLTTEPREGDG